MIQKNTLLFLKGLAQNNHKDWFEKNRKVYENAKADYLQFVTVVLNEMKTIDESLLNIEPKHCVFRINRDVRFSKNKDPYKTNMGAHFSMGGKKIQTAGYYFHCEPGKSFIAGGIWMPMANELKNIRQEIDYNYTEFKSIVTKPNFKKVFGTLDNEFKLSRPPKGYEENNEAIEFLKLKSFTVTAPISDKDLTDKNLVKKVITHFETMKPFIQFLNRSLVA